MGKRRLRLALIRFDRKSHNGAIKSRHEQHHGSFARWIGRATHRNGLDVDLELLLFQLDGIILAREQRENFAGILLGEYRFGAPEYYRADGSEWAVQCDLRLAAEERREWARSEIRVGGERIDLLEL